MRANTRRVEVHSSALGATRTPHSQDDWGKLLGYRAKTGSGNVVGGRKEGVGAALERGEHVEAQRGEAELSDPTLIHFIQFV